MLQHTKVVAFTATDQDNDGFATTKLLILQQHKKLWHFTASHQKNCFILEQHIKADLADEKLRKKKQKEIESCY